MGCPNDACAGTANNRAQRAVPAGWSKKMGGGRGGVVYVCPLPEVEIDRLSVFKLFIPTAADGQWHGEQQFLPGTVDSKPCLVV